MLEITHTTTLAVDGAELHVTGTGSGPDLLLVHGSWSDHRVWDLVTPALSESFRVLRIDRRGHGASTRPAGTRRRQEDDLATVIERVAEGPVRLVGTSFGGSIALGLTARRPDLVEALSIHEPPLLSLAPGDAATQAELAAVGEAVADVVERAARGAHRDAAERFATLVLGPGAFALLPPVTRATMVATAGSFVVEQSDPGWAAIDPADLGAISCPVLVTDGDQSPAWFRAITGALVELVPGARRQTIPGAGHAPHATHPERFAAVVAGAMTPAAALR